MLNSVFLWILFTASSVISIGCALAILILVVGVFYHLRKDDAEMSAKFAILVLILMVLSLGFIFATVALGRIIL